MTYNLSVKILVGGDDYGSGPYNVLFAAEETVAQFSVPITDDDLVEEEEKFSLDITSTSLPLNIKIGSPEKATVTIMDDDGKHNLYNCVVKARCS